MSANELTDKVFDRQIVSSFSSMSETVAVELVVRELIGLHAVTQHRESQSGCVKAAAFLDDLMNSFDLLFRDKSFGNNLEMVFVAIVVDAVVADKGVGLFHVCNPP